MILDKLPFILIGYLLLTIFLEGLLSLFFGIKKRDLIYIVLMNLCTNPLLNIICILSYITYFKTGYFVAFIFLEIIAFVIEGMMLKKVLDYIKINPFLFSLYLNSFSVFCGIVVNQIV